MAKAICEMTLEELNAEYLYCIAASQEEALDTFNRAYFRDRANVVKKYISQLEHESMLG